MANIVKELDKLNDQLAGQDVDSGQTISAALSKLADVIGSGGGGGGGGGIPAGWREIEVYPNGEVGTKDAVLLAAACRDLSKHDSSWDADVPEQRNFDGLLFTYYDESQTDGIVEGAPAMEEMYSGSPQIHCIGRYDEPTHSNMYISVASARMSTYSATPADMYPAAVLNFAKGYRWNMSMAPGSDPYLFPYSARTTRDVSLYGKGLSEYPYTSYESESEAIDAIVAALKAGSTFYAFGYMTTSGTPTTGEYPVSQSRIDIESDVSSEAASITLYSDSGPMASYEAGSSCCWISEAVAAFPVKVTTSGAEPVVNWQIGLGVRGSEAGTVNGVNMDNIAYAVITPHTES